MTVPFVPLNWRQTADEIAWQLRDAGITLLIVDEERATVAKTACADLPVTIVPIAELERSPPPVESRTSHPGSISSGKRRSSTPPGPAGGRRALASPMATSGSARSPPPSTSVITPTMSGWRRCRCSTSAGSPSSSAALSARFPWSFTSDSNRNASLAAIDDGVTLLSVVPAMLQRMLDARGDAPWPPSLRSVLLGGSAAPPRLVEECVSSRHPRCPDLRAHGGHVAGNDVAAGPDAAQAVILRLAASSHRDPDRRRDRSRSRRGDRRDRDSGTDNLCRLRRRPHGGIA